MAKDKTHILLDLACQAEILNKGLVITLSRSIFIRNLIKGKIIRKYIKHFLKACFAIDNFKINAQKHKRLFFL